MSKVYVIGATGGIGTQAVKELLERGVSVTTLVRDPSKAATLFGQAENLNVVQGDYSSFDSFKSTIAGHERLFLLVSDIQNMVTIKTTYAKLAYEAGVKQIVHVSSGTVSGSWRQNIISTGHYYSEEAIFNLPNRGGYVVLRPMQFFTNQFFNDANTVKSKNAIFSSAPPDQKSAWVSPNDIAHLAVNVLTEPIEKHGDIVYDMTTEMISGNDRAEILSRVIGKDVKYVQIPVEQQYKVLTEIVQMPHSMAYALVDHGPGNYDVNHALPIVLHRPVEKLEAWFEVNKAKFM
jgi:uncharacterized protein YbjT (DUF2867 family)